MEVPTTSSDACVPPVPLNINTYQSKIRYKELVSKLVRIYQTYACSLSKDEQLEFCRVMEHAEYECDVSITRHKIYRQMFHYPRKRWFRSNITFSRWAVMATLFHKPGSTPSALNKLAKAVSTVGLGYQACFDKYKSCYETNLCSLELPDAYELSKCCDNAIVFAGTSSGLPSSASPVANDQNTTEPDEFNAWELYTFVKDLDLEYTVTLENSRGSNPSGEAASQPGGAQAVAHEIVTAERTDSTPATPNKRSMSDLDIAARKHRLSASPASQNQPPPKKQDRRTTAKTDSDEERRTTAAPPSGRIFFEEMEKYCLETNEVIESLQVQIKRLDAQTTSALPDLAAASKVATDIEVGNTAFQQTIHTEIEKLKSEISSIAERQDKMKHDISKCRQDCSDISAGQTTKASMHAANTKRALTRMEKKQDTLQSGLESNLALIEDEKKAAERHRKATDAAMEEMKESRGGEAAPGLTKDDVASILDKLFQEKLVYYLRLHSKAKDEVKVEK